MIVHKPVIVFVLSLVLTGLSACSPRALHEAEEVVRTADSLRVAGQMYDDSAQLAQTYETLRSIPLPFRRRMSCEHSNRDWLGLGSLYAHACYHYGRLLREKNNPVAAMECFISASHARTRDYHILGRVYSNMGSICHLAGDFPLSYDMYEHSADCFLRNGDTLLYYYALNDMAFELAEQGKTEETLRIINKVDDICTDENVKIKLLETKALLYRQVEQYDSAIYYINLSIERGYNLPTGMLIKAQAFSYLAEKDSALFYARKVVNETRSINDIYNALYILSYDDTTLVGDEVLKLTSQRDDLHTYEIDVKKTEHSKAVQLLEQDLQRKPNLVWLYAVLATLLITGSFASVYIYYKHRKHQLLSQHISDLEGQNQETQTRMRNNVEERCALYRASQHIAKDLCCTDYDKMCQIADQQFYMIASKLRSKQILNQTEVRLCILVLIDLNRIGLSKALPYSISGVGKLKDHTAKELGTTGKNLRDFLLNLAIEG